MSDNLGTNNSGFSGQQGLTDDTSEFNKQAFLVRQILGRVRTMLPVQVMAVTTTGLVAPVGFVNVQPMVNMVDSGGNATQHGIIQNIPYSRIQGGKNAIIMDPQIGDIGWCGFADRDISSVKANKAISNPGSFRRFDMADGIYLGGILNQAPTQYLRFVQDGDGNPAGIEVVDALGNNIKTSSAGIAWTDLNGNTIISDSSGITINGVLIDQSQNVTASGEGSFGGGGQFVKLADGTNATKLKAT